MTWIVGTVLPFGQAIIVSDICVTFRSGRQMDCLQKIHHLGNDVVCGFAGSVKIGFQLARLLANELSKRKDESLNISVKTWLPRLLKRAFATTDAHERTHGCQLILTSAHPLENVGESHFPRTNLWTFSAPEFIPKHANCQMAVGIGSGSHVEDYCKTVNDLCSSREFMQTVTVGEGFQPQFLAFMMHEAITQKPTAGISSFLQIGLISRNKTLLSDNSNYTPLDLDGKPLQNSFPTIAREYQEFCELCNRSAVASAEASCVASDVI